MFIKNKIQRLLFIVLLIFTTTSLRAQEKLDSLYKVVGSMPDDTSKLSVYHYLCEYSYDIDTANKYCNLMVDLAQKLNNQYYLALAYSYLSRYYIWISDYEHAFWANTESIYLWEELENKTQLAFMYMNMGVILTMETDYKSAAKYYHISLNSFRELCDSTYITQVLQSLGFINVIVNSYSSALNYYTEAQTIDSLTNNTRGLVSDNICIARIYLNKYKSRPRDSASVKLLKNARRHFDIAYNLALTYPNTIEMQLLHVSKASVYIEEAVLTTGKERHALLDSCEMHMLRLSKMQNLYNNITFNKAEMQIVLAQTEMLRGNFGKSQKHLIEAQTEIETNTPLTYLKRELYFTYQYYYQLVGDYKKAAEYATKVQYLLMDFQNDELLSNIERTKMQTEFDERMRKRALEDYEHEQQLKKQAAKQRTLFLVVFTTISTILIMLLISGFRRKKLNLLLSKKNLMLDERNLQLQSAKEELSIQNDMLNNINKSLTDSITYAKHIQEAAIPTNEQMNKIFGDCLIIFKPCNIVSGDFYWAVHIGRYKALAVADCTGHGVPGALMSMLGISMLNDIVANIDMKSTEVHASDVLEIMRSNVIKALRQDQTEGRTFDGIDMALMLIDAERQQMQYAGAFRPLIMVRNNELTKFEPNRMPIGIYNKHNSFTNNVIDIQPGDTFYAYSDGITDQFRNSSSIEKFGRHRLYSILLDNYYKPFSEQKQILLDAFNNWRQSDTQKTPVEQIDDMLLIGIRV